MNAQNALPQASTSVTANTVLDDPLMTAREGAALIGVSVPAWHKWVRLGRLPKPVKLGWLARWPRSEIIAVIEKAKAARDAA